MDTANNVPQISMSGWLPNGMRAFFTIPLAPSQFDNAYQIAFQFSENLIKNGLRLTEPGLEAGELKETAGWVARGIQTNDDGETPVVFLYADNQKMTYKLVKCYLNTPDDISTFEAASGLHLLDLPLWDQKGEPQRGAVKEDEYVIRCARTFTFVYKKNPNYNPDEKDVKKKKPQNLFVRFDIQPPPPAPAQSNASASNSSATPPIATVTPKVAENAENPLFDDVVHISLQTTDAQLEKLCPGWSGIKDQMLTKVFPDFYNAVVNCFHIYNAMAHAQASIRLLVNDSLLDATVHTAAQALVIVLNHREVKYGPTTTKVDTDDFTEAAERAMKEAG